MERLNYHHLLYFWMVAREGSVSAAARRLFLAQPTLSAQIRQLEESLGEKLFQREGRRLRLTDAGRTAFRYADEIFRLGGELPQALRDEHVLGTRLAVGVADVVPKLIAHRLLEPVLQLDPPVRLEVREERTERLLPQLATHELDVVLTDRPVSPGLHVNAFSHLLGESGIVLLAAPRLAARARKRFPRTLDGVPFLLPGRDTALHRALEQWFSTCGVQPRIVGEFDDTALLKVFGMRGAGVFACPEAIETEVRSQYHVARVGAATGVRERFYALTIERRLRHPGVVAISDRARKSLFRSRSK